MGFYMKSQFFACRASNEDIKSWRDRRSANHQINLFIIVLMSVHFFLSTHSSLFRSVFLGLVAAPHHRHLKR